MLHKNKKKTSQKSLVLLVPLPDFIDKPRKYDKKSVKSQTDSFGWHLKDKTSHFESFISCCGLH